MRRLWMIPLMIACSATLALSAFGDSTVEVTNYSDWVIMEFYMSPSDDSDWGPDLLGDEVLGEGDELMLSNISCDDWDVMFIDEDGDECIIEEVDLCGDHATWEITNDELLSCID